MESHRSILLICVVSSMICFGFPGYNRSPFIWLLCTPHGVSTYCAGSGQEGARPITIDLGKPVALAAGPVWFQFARLWVAECVHRRSSVYSNHLPGVKYNKM